MLPGIFRERDSDPFRPVFDEIDVAGQRMFLL
jgi:hypothetical protein